MLIVLCLMLLAFAYIPDLYQINSQTLNFNHIKLYYGS